MAPKLAEPMPQSEVPGFERHVMAMLHFFELESVRPNCQNPMGQIVTSHGVCWSGEGGIRTLGELAPTLVFETSTIGHSVTSPDPPQSLGPAAGGGIINSNLVASQA